MSKPSQFQLSVQFGPEAGTTYPLTGDLLTIGRYSGNAIIIPDDQVSRIHARLAKTADGYTIEDLGSSNGLFVNDERVTCLVSLSIGDQIRLGTSVVLAYETCESGDATPIEPSQPSQSGSKGNSPPRPVSDTSGTVYMKKLNVGLPDQEKRQSFLSRLLGSLLGKKDDD
ncbi:MAG: FHA domain-containing protein [Anaerolineae bacterium]|nr:FHA domain-containing protein [Anaerolineae bacterium]